MSLASLTPGMAEAETTKNAGDQAVEENDEETNVSAPINRPTAFL